MRRCHRSARKPRSAEYRTTPSATQRRSAVRSTSPVLARFAPLSTNQRAAIEMAPPTAARRIAPERIVPARPSAGRGRRLGTARRQLGAPTNTQPVEQVARNDAQGGDPVDDAALEPDRARLLEVARRDRDLADPPAHPGGDHLGDQLLVEDEIVAVQPVRDRLQQTPAVSPETRVVLGQVE